MANHVSICTLIITCAFVTSLQYSSTTVVYPTIVEQDFVPSKPRNLSVLVVHSNEIRLSWTQSRPENRSIDGYFIYYMSSNNNYTDVRTFKKPPMRAYIEYNLNDLEPNTEYIIFVKAFTSKNEGDSSKSVVTKTDIGRPSAPRHLNVTCQAQNRIYIEWERPQHYFYSIDRYYIYIYSDDDLPYRNYTIPSSEKYFEVMYSVENITTNRIYKIQVTAASYSKLTNRFLKGEVSEARKVFVYSNCNTEQQSYRNYSTVEYDQDDLIPSTPRNFSVLEVNSNNIRLSWIKPRRSNGDIDGYIVFYRFSNYTDFRTFKKPPMGAYIEYTLDGLKPNTEYAIFVKAFTSKNEGEPSELIRSKTANRGPSAPRHLNVVCQAQNTIFIQWERPDHFFNNTIDYYYINIFLSDANITYQNYIIPTSQEYLKVSFSVANVTSNEYKVQVRGVSYSQSSDRALLQGQATEAKEVYVQFDCDKLQQYNMRHATVCSELIY